MRQVQFRYRLSIVSRKCTVRSQPSVRYLTRIIHRYQYVKWHTSDFPRACLCTYALNNQCKRVIRGITISTIYTELTILRFFTRPAKFVFDFFHTDEVAKWRILLGINILIACPLRVREVKIFNAFRKTLIKMRRAYPLSK